MNCQHRGGSAKRALPHPWLKGRYNWRSLKTTKETMTRNTELSGCKRSMETEMKPHGHILETFGF